MLWPLNFGAAGWIFLSSLRVRLQGVSNPTTKTEKSTDEETPLLGNGHRNTKGNNLKKKRTPLPWRQFSILLLLQVSEPISAHVIAPFLPQLIRDIGITNGEDSRVGYYVGLTHMLFFLTEACTIYHWSKASDQIGRKPVLLTGLFGLSTTLFGFGLSTTFWGLVISRCLCGALNGNVGVMKSMAAEMTDPTNMAQAYAIIPFTWSIGTTAGPLIGGSLARPAERFPEVFGQSEFLKKYPYFLPCSVSASVTAISWIITFLFLKETTTPRKTIRQYFFGGQAKRHAESERSRSAPHDGPMTELVDGQIPFRSLLVRPVLVAAGSYASFSLFEIAFRAILPVFYATPIAMGGLDLDPPSIGIILSYLGMANGILQWMFFTRLHDWLGTKTMFVAMTSLCLPITALFPVINAVARTQGLSNLVWFLVGLQVTVFAFAIFAFGITFMYISGAAPNKASMGATNGFAQMTVSVMRALGPAAASSAFSLGIEKNILGGYLAYWVMTAMVGLTLWVGYLLPRSPWNE